MTAARPRPTLRLGVPEDGAAVAAIYRPYVTSTHISFEEVPPSPDEMARRIEEGGRTHPWVVAETEGHGLGYAMSTPHRRRAAYRWTVEVGLYVAQSHHRAGIGRHLYVALLGLLAEQGYAGAMAGVTRPNPASVAFHRAMGFATVGLHPRLGFKQGAWRDVLWLHRSLRPELEAERPPSGNPRPVTAALAARHLAPSDRPS